MMPSRWVWLMVFAAVSPSPSSAQDLAFLQVAIDQAAASAEEYFGITVSGPRFIGSAATLAALEQAGLPVPASQLGDALTTFDPQAVVVDSIAEVTVTGPPNDPRLQEIDEQRVRTIMTRIDEWPDLVRWVRQDGIYLEAWKIRPTEEGYEIWVGTAVTFQSRDPVRGLPGVNVQSFHVAVRVVRRDGMWVWVGRDGG